MEHIDFFNFFRIVLEIFVSVYATVVTMQSLYGWFVFLSGSDRHVSLMRQYVVLQGLRLRFRNFWGDVLVCIGLSIVLLMLWHAHRLVEGIDPFIYQHVIRLTKPH